MIPLNLAAVRGRMDIVKFLIEKHCDPMSRDIYGNTALHHAVLNGQLEILKFLIEKLKCPPDIIIPGDLIKHDPTPTSLIVLYIYTAIVYDEADWALYVQCVLSICFSFL